MRTFTHFSYEDPVAKQLVDELHTIQGNPMKYQEHMLQIGRHLGAGIVPKLPKIKILRFVLYAQSKTRIS